MQSTIENESLIYESPDGGNTVYARRFGESERELVYKSPIVEAKERWYRWADILAVAPKSIALNDAITKAEMIYAIIKKEKD